MKRERREKAELSARLLTRSRPARDWPARPLARLSRPAALAVLVLLAAALGWSAMAGGSLADAAAAGPVEAAERVVTARIADRVAAGEAYHEAALAEHRAAGLAVTPILAVPLPALAYADATLGRGAMSLGLVLLLLASLFAWHRKLAGRTALAERLAAMVLLGLAGSAVFGLFASLAHELVAGLLLSLALAAHRSGFAIPALVATAAALAASVAAMPFALVWLGLAWFERRRREAWLIALLLAAFGAMAWLHAFTIMNLMPAGVASLAAEGGSASAMMLLDALARSFPFSAVPRPLVGPLAVLALLGWLALGGRLGLWAFLSLAGCAVMALLPWWPFSSRIVLLMLPFGIAGLAFAPRGLADLVRCVLRNG